MRCNETNRHELREFLIKVRTMHGLGIVEFARLIGLRYSMWQQIEDGSKKIGSRSLRRIAEALELSPDIVSAILDPNAGFVKLPPPESISLKKPEKEDILINLEMLNQMMTIVSAAGTLPLSEIRKLLR